MPTFCVLKTAPNFLFMVYKIQELINIFIRISTPRKKLFLFGSIVFLVVFSISILYIKNNSSTAGGSVLGDNRFSLPDSKAKKDIQKEFTFPLKDKEGEEVSTIKYIILDVQLQDQIISQGKPYTTVKGRTILILNLKITNQYDQAISINTKDYVRLSVNSNEEWLAADFHHDPVSIQPISTKYTRLGFPIYDIDKDLKLQVGEIGGEKEIINLTF